MPDELHSPPQIRPRRDLHRHPELPQTLPVYPPRPPPRPIRLPQLNVALPLTTANPPSLTFNHFIIDIAVALSFHCCKPSVTLSHKPSITTSPNPRSPSPTNPPSLPPC
ncbi:hypothetical protein Scep_002830 [Stephania cephalantha]|uniref:Uncharacterized protein n=1 Tax=Stephania cephalantha TaxID=152367 RepID=A0AAP0LEN8_9MAGN